MKKSLLFITLIILLIAMIAFVYVKRNSLKIHVFSTLPTPTTKTVQITFATPTTIPQPTINPSVTYCRTQDLQAKIVTDHAAGNVYDTFTIKNISGKPCSIIGNEYISPNFALFDNEKPPVLTEHIGKQQSALLQLAPNQTIYSQAHYPNGPQCQTGIQNQNTFFTYLISPGREISFTDQTGSISQTIVACSSSAEETTVQIWNMSTTPISP